MRTVLICVVVVTGLALLHKPFSSSRTISAGLFVLPVSVFGGYLAGKWRWQEFEKKYPE